MSMCSVLLQCFAQADRTARMRGLLFLKLLSYFLVVVSANVEKTIFLGPPAITVPTQHPNLDDLYLISLSPLHATVRTHLNASFPAGGSPKGTETWVLLDGLTPGARYEVRICWLATVGVPNFTIPAP